MLDIMEWTRLQDFSDAWRDRTSRAINYHPGPSGRGADYVFYDQWTRRKIDDQTAWSWSMATHVVPDDITPCWVQDEEDVEGTPYDECRDSKGYVQSFSAQFQTGHVPGYYPGAIAGAADAHDSGADQQSGRNQPTGGGDDESTKGSFLEEVGVISYNEPTMNLNEMRTYVGGRLAR